MISFSEWLKIRESSPITRAKDAWLRGTGVPLASPSVNSKATGSPALVAKVMRQEKKRKKHKKKS